MQKQDILLFLSTTSSKYFLWTTLYSSAYDYEDFPLGTYFSLYALIYAYLVFPLGLKTYLYKNKLRLYITSESLITCFFIHYFDGWIIYVLAKKSTYLCFNANLQSMSYIFALMKEFHTNSHLWFSLDEEKATWLETQQQKYN
jgi:hypothetical protein